MGACDGNPITALHGFTAYLGADGITDDWVRDNVLPKLGDLEVMHTSNDAMLESFAGFYMANKGDADVIAHMDDRSEAEGLEGHHPLYDSVAAAVAYMHLMQ